ncbi:E3 ubiquitin-protein ligase RNF169 isoform X2 [Lissotriton helveticus]
MDFASFQLWLTEVTLYGEFVFRAPVHISKPGELREEYEGQLKKFSDNLSDSENEEPFRGRAAHRSAFISKSSSYTSASLAGDENQTERSHSCDDAVNDRSRSRRKALQSSKAKISLGVNSSVAGVLLSTENNRSFSAPDFISDKRPSGNLISMPQKPERSISPESNDSISEELNHFKPIVCSPCTPPKRLPNGKVLRPPIIKSTPRNLRRNLQSQTSYEASPRVLQKWDVIFQDRQTKNTLSQGTLTSSPTISGEDILASEQSKKKSPPVNKQLHDRSEQNAGTSVLHLISSERDGKSKSNNNSEALLVKEHTFLLPETVIQKPSENSQSCSDTEVPAKSELDVSQICRVECRRCPVGSQLVEERQTGTLPLAKTKGKRPNRQPNNCLGKMQNGTCGVGTERSPSQQHSRKRRCKTKHLEQRGSLKRLKQVTTDSPLLADDLLRTEEECKLRQEEEDRKLAFRLQRVLNSEILTVNRRRGSEDEYLLRSNSTTRAST